MKWIDKQVIDVVDAKQREATLAAQVGALREALEKRIYSLTATGRLCLICGAFAFFKDGKPNHYDICPLSSTSAAADYVKRVKAQGVDEFLEWLADSTHGAGGCVDFDAMFSLQQLNARAAALAGTEGKS